MSQVGLRDLHIAILTKDTPTELAYETPLRIAGAINATINPTINTQELFADDQVWESVTALGKIDVEIETADLPLGVRGLLAGQEVIGGGLTETADVLPPHIALGFRSLKSTGGWRYIWLFKGVPQPIAEDFATRTDSVDHKTPKVKFVFMPRINDSAWRRTVDSDSELETFFASVPV